MLGLGLVVALNYREYRSTRPYDEMINPLPPSDAVRKQKIYEGLPPKREKVAPKQTEP